MIQIVKDREILKRGENEKKEEETRRETSRVSPKLEPETKKRTRPLTLLDPSIPGLEQ